MTLDYIQERAFEEGAGKQEEQTKSTRLQRIQAWAWTPYASKKQ